LEPDEEFFLFAPQGPSYSLPRALRLLILFLGRKQLKFQPGDGSIFTTLLSLTLLGLLNMEAAFVKREGMNKSWLEFSRERLKQDQQNGKVIAIL